jgi:hypothetical protein
MLQGCKFKLALQCYARGRVLSKPGKPGSWMTSRKSRELYSLNFNLDNYTTENLDFWRKKKMKKVE